MVDTRLYLPKEWADDKKRRKQAGVPEEIRYKTRHQLSLQMLDEKGSLLPHSWITGDDEMGRPYWFRRALDKRNEQYLLAIPSNTLIRDMDAEPPAYKGVGQPPKRPWQHVDKWIKSLHENEWTTIDVRDGAKGPLEVQIVKRRVAARTNQRRQAPQETLVVTRYRNRDEKSATETDYHLSNAPYDTTLEEFARVAKGHHRIEECFQRAKGEAGLADYQVRNWRGWHHHQTLCLIGCWFLVTETRRGKKWTPAITLQQIQDIIALVIHRRSECGTYQRIIWERGRWVQRNELARFYHWKRRKQLAPLNINRRQM